MADELELTDFDEDRTLIRGLDKRGQITIIEENIDLIDNRVPVTPNDMRYPTPIYGDHTLYMTGADMNAVLALFPTQSLERSGFILDGWINLYPPSYFSKRSKIGRTVTTNDPTEALSPNAVVFGKASYNSGDDRSVLNFYELNLPLSDEIKRAIQLFVLAHELTHTIVHREMDPTHYILLRLPNGRIVTAREYLLEVIGPALLNHSPITQYSGVYRRSGIVTYKMLSEELSETVAAYIFGFANRRERDLVRTPFADRPEVFDMIDQYLHAEYIGRYP